MKCLIFVPCERVIFESGTDTTSIIVVMHQINLGTSEPKEFPVNQHLIPMRWNIFSQFEMEDSDRGKSYSQRITLARFSGDPILQNVQDFDIKREAPLHRMIAALDFFPLLPSGTYRLRLEVKSEQDDWREVGSYPLVVNYVG